MLIIPYFPNNSLIECPASVPVACLNSGLPMSRGHGDQRWRGFWVAALAQTSIMFRSL